jgi:hypothetical protein
VSPIIKWTGKEVLHSWITYSATVTAENCSKAITKTSGNHKTSVRPKYLYFTLTYRMTLMLFRWKLQMIERCWNSAFMYIYSLLFWCYCSWARNEIRQSLYVISCLYWTINVLFLQVHKRRASNAVQTATCICPHVCWVLCWVYICIYARIIIGNHD